MSSRRHVTSKQCGLSSRGISSAERRECLAVRRSKGLGSRFRGGWDFAGWLNDAVLHSSQFAPARSVGRDIIAHKIAATSTHIRRFSMTPDPICRPACLSDHPKLLRTSKTVAATLSEPKADGPNDPRRARLQPSAVAARRSSLRALSSSKIQLNVEPPLRAVG